MERKMIYNSWKKTVAALFALLLIVSCVCCMETNGSEVCAEETTNPTVSFIAEKKDNVAEYRDKTYTYPKPTTTGKEDWVFAGWYQEETCENPYKASALSQVTSAYAKFVPAEVLSVKCQVTTGTDEYTDKTSMRFISTIDSTNYSEVGFEITSNGKTHTFSSTNVYKRINSVTSGLECGFSPVAFDTESEYFMTFTLTNIANKNFERVHFVRPYWRTLDGTTVYGMSRNVRVSDSYNQIANIPVRLYSDATVTAGSLEVAYDTTVFEYIGYEVGNVDKAATAVNDTANKTVTCNLSQQTVKPDGMLVNLRFKVVGDVTSNTTFTVTNTSIKNGETAIPVANIIHKTYSVKYDGTNADTSWYDEFKNEEELVIATSVDLYGLAKIVNDVTNGDNFYGQTIYMAADIVVNEGKSSAWTNPYPWDSIGNGTGTAYQFGGTFDGQGNTISGIYQNTSTTYAGLFGLTSIHGVIQNLRLEESKITSTVSGSDAYVGGVIGFHKGPTLTSIYSKADIIASGNMVGGVVGIMKDEDISKTQTISDCWFDGTVTSTARKVGGVVGYTHASGNASSRSPVHMYHCLNTGTVTSTYSGPAEAGGLIGYADNGTDLDMWDCLNIGEVSIAVNNRVGSVVGHIPGSGKAKFTNVYTTNNMTGSVIATSPDGYAGLGSSSTTTAITGAPIVKEATELTGNNAITNEIALGFYDSGVNLSGHWVLKTNSNPELKTFATENVLITPNITWYSANTETKTCIITTPEELYGLAKLANVDGETFAGWTINLGKDIQINSGSAGSWASKAPMYPWNPITSFAGTLEGNGHTINGIYVNDTVSVSGLFRVVTGTVQNLGLKNSYFYSTKDIQGSIAGRGQGATFTNIYSEATVKAEGGVVGGLIGQLNTTANSSFEKCWFDGSVNTSATGAGGILGGIVLNTTSVNNCLNTGIINSTCEDTTNGTQAGGLVGYAGYNGTLTLSNSINAGKVDTTSDVRVGALVGFYRAGNMENAYSISDTNEKNVGTGNQTGSAIRVERDFLYGIAGYMLTDLTFDNPSTEEVEGAWAAREGQIPALASWVDEPLELVTEDISWYDADKDEFIITDIADLYGLASLVNDYNNNTFKDKKIYLASDIVLNLGDASEWDSENGVKNPWIPIGYRSNEARKFEGTFDGQGHSVSGIYFASNVDSLTAGLFGHVKGGTIQNLRIENSFIENTYTLTNTYAGSVAGHGLNSTFKNIYSDATVINTKGRAGGIVGQLGLSGQNSQDTIQECWFEGNVSAANLAVGGIVGYVYYSTSNISDCLNTGNVISTYEDTQNGAWAGGICGAINMGGALNIENSINAGQFTVEEKTINVGSLVGYIGGGSVTYSFINAYGTTKDYSAMVGNGAESGRDVGTIEFADGQLDGTEGYVLADIDFYVDEKDTGVWVARTDDVPSLKYWTDENGIVDLTDVETIDTSWADDPDATEYFISDRADLYGLEQLVNGGRKFEDTKITLTSDIVFNLGRASEWDSENGPKNLWTPIGYRNNTERHFYGDFDGNGKTISGMYVSSIDFLAGLFGGVQSGVLENIRLSNSYIYNGYEEESYVGSVAARCYNMTLRNIYSDAIVESKQSIAGGIAGRFNTTLATIENCWFDGQVTSGGQYGTGGVVGYVCNVPATMKNCLNTGTVTGSAETYAYVGGLCGGVRIGAASLTIEDCLNTGKIQFTVPDGSNSAGGSLVGGNALESGVTIKNYAYATTQSFAKPVGGNEPILSDGAIVQLDENIIKGYGGFLNTDLSLDNTGSATTGSGTWVAIVDQVPVPKTLEDMISGGRVDLSCFIIGDNTTATKGTDVGDYNYQYTVDNEDYYATYLSKLEGLGFGEPYASSVVDNVSSTTFKKDDLVLVVTKANGKTHISASSGDAVSERLLNTATSQTVDDGYTATTTLDVTLGMPRLSTEEAMSFVIQLKNGHFIIYDGGETAADLEVLMTYLTERSDNKKPIIDAWVVSHAHNDHFGIKFVETLISDYADDIYVESIYFNQPTDALAVADDPTYDMTMTRYENIKTLAGVLNTTQGAHPKVYRPHTGQKYYFDGVSMDIVLTQEHIDIANTEEQDFNETSTWCMFNIERGTETEKVLIGADGGEIGMTFVQGAYTTGYLAVDVFAALHHGSNTNSTFKKYCTVDKVVLYAHTADPIATGSIWDYFKESYQNNKSLIDSVTTGVEDQNGTTHKYFYYGQGTVVLTFASDAVKANLITE